MWEYLMAKVQINNIILLERSCHYHYHQYTRRNYIKNASFQNTRNSLSWKMFILLSIGAEANCLWIAAPVPVSNTWFNFSTELSDSFSSTGVQVLHNSFSALVCSTISLISWSPRSSSLNRIFRQGFCLYLVEIPQLQIWILTSNCCHYFYFCSAMIPQLKKKCSACWKQEFRKWMFFLRQH